MTRLDTVFARVFLVCGFGLMALFLFVPETAKADNIFAVPGVWGYVAKGLSAVAFSAAAASMILAYTRRRRLMNSPWPVVHLQQPRHAGKHAPDDEYMIVFESESDTWIFLEDEIPVAALRQLAGRLGNRLKFYDDELEVISWNLRTGGMLMDGSAELAVGKKTLWTGRIEIHAEHRIYQIRRRFVDIFGRTYYLTLNGQKAGQFTKIRDKKWTAQVIRDTELHLAVFMFWLIKQSIAREG